MINTNSKFQIRNPKEIQNSNILNSFENYFIEHLNLINISIFEFRACF